MIPGFGVTVGLSTAGSPNSGGYSSYCARESVMSYHEALDPTKMCACGFIPSSPSRLPAGHRTLPTSFITIGVIEPQTRQNPGVPPDGDTYFAIESSPDTHRKPASGALTKVANAAPWRLRHIEQ